MKPFQYQNKRKSQYFEGWYCRIYSRQDQLNYAVIFAISKAKDDPHSFIQFIDGTSHKMTYYRFDIKDFRYIDNVVHIGPNQLSINHIYLKFDTIQLKGTIVSPLHINSFFGWKSAMGFLSVFPLQCFQEVLYLDSEFTGTLQTQQGTKKIKGQSYMEKTYGHQFPSQWIWIQCNQFSKKNIRLSLSIGAIPFLKWSVLGYIVFLNMNGIELRFASYNRSSINIINNDNMKEIHLKRKQYNVIIRLLNHNPITLVGPSLSGVMDLDVLESITSTISVKVYKKKKCILDVIGTDAGAEWMMNPQS